MSTISGIASAGSAWPTPGNQRTSRPPGGMERGEMKDRMFAKVDADGSGGVDATELQGLLDKVAKKTGASADAAANGSASDLLTKMDGNGDGSLNKDELDAGMKSLMPQPASTVAFAKGRGGPGGPGGSPPPEAADSSSTSSSTSTDPLDTDGDGVVSQQEIEAGKMKDILKALAKAVDSNRDGTLGSGELDSFKSTLESVLKSAGSPSQGDAASSSSSNLSGSQQPALDLRTLAARVLQQYAQAANDGSGAGSTVNVAA